ncbi:MAG TPA: hypothetical protein VF832_17185 [Longimicrobiales bacterium]
MIQAPVPEVLASGALVIVAVFGMGAIVLKTAINGLVRLRAARQPPPQALPPADDARVAALEEEVRQLRESLDKVTAIVEFDHQLRGGTSPPPLPRP